MSLGVINSFMTTLLVSLLAAGMLLAAPVIGRRVRASTRCVVWGLFLLRLLLPFSFYSPLRLSVPVQMAAVSIPGAGDSEVTAGNEEESRPDTTEPGWASAFPWTAIVWGGGAILFCTWHIGVMRNFRRRAERMSRPLKEEGLAPGGMRIVVTGAVSSPVLTGWRKPCLYLPVRRYKAEELSLIYLHEEQHRRQGDIPVKYLLLFVRGLLWFNPVAHWLAARLRRDMELRCDETVLGKMEAAQRLAYGELLLRMAGEGGRVPLSAAGFLEKRSLVRERIETVLGEGRKRRGLWLVLPVMALLIGVSLVTVVPDAAAAPLPPAGEESDSGAAAVQPGGGEEPWGWPVPGCAFISSGYGYRWGRLHPGIDIAGGPSSVGNQPVAAAAAGRVLETGYSETEGNIVWLDHGNGWRTYYAHLSVIETSPGGLVRQGEIIGRVGDSGQVTGPHLHFGLYHNGTACDPLAYLEKGG